MDSSKQRTAPTPRENRNESVTMKPISISLKDRHLPQTVSIGRYAPPVFDGTVTYIREKTVDCNRERDTRKESILYKVFFSLLTKVLLFFSINLFSIYCLNLFCIGCKQPTEFEETKDYNR